MPVPLVCGLWILCGKEPALRRAGFRGKEDGAVAQKIPEKINIICRFD
jgi:hypothetical protein